MIGIPTHKIICGNVIDILKDIPEESVDMILTSPPYWGLRSYLPDDHPDKAKEIGLEPTLDLYLDHLLEVMRELKRVLKKTGVIFWNHGDCYGGSGAGTWKNSPEVINSKEVYHLPYGSNPRKRNNRSNAKPKCMCLQNYRFILRCIDELGLILRNVIIWHKPNHMPSSVKDRFTNAYEPVFMLTKSKKYWFDLDAVRVPHKESKEEYEKKLKKNPGKGDKWGMKGIIKYSTHEAIERRFILGKNPGDVWTIPTQPFKESHFAVFPKKLIEPMIKAGCPQWICKKCGKARVRITKTDYEVLRKSKKQDQPKVKAQIEQGGNPNLSVFKFAVGKANHETIGWTDCQCEGEDKYQPGIVLDPFAGSGTVGVVAERLGRNSILIDIKKEYCHMALKRLKPLVEQTKLEGKESKIEKEGF